MGSRVVVTGIGGLTALGHNWPQIAEHLRARRSGVRHMDEWADIESLNTRLAAPVMAYDLPAHYTRKRTRSMSPVSLMSTRTSEMALEDAGLLGDPIVTSGMTGVAHGACAGSAEAVARFGLVGQSRQVRGITSNTYVRMMSHTGPVNISLFFGLRGRVITTSSACTSASQAIGFSYETLQAGKQEVMIAGGGEELSFGIAAVFDRLFATSTRNDEPEATPRPYDRDRDGLVVGDGAVSLILEPLERARARGASIYAEVVGFGTNTDGSHITQPQPETMAAVMRQALADADLSPDAIGFVSAHGTATDRGDVAESRATQDVFGSRMPIASLKSYFGHTLGGCGALEAWLTIQMMREGWFAPTLNLDNLDPECAELDYITGNGRELDIEYFMSNNFAFGGINTSLIFRRWA